jgi:uncharacterized protein YndB with AHSA1/START domain
MSSPNNTQSTDLVFERVFDVPPELVWQAWTRPEHIVHWFTPAPWKTTHCEIDLRPGGKFRTIMEGPDGEKNDGTGCFLEVVPNKRLVWTDGLREDFRPNEKTFFTAVLTFTPRGNGTHYHARAMHPTEEARNQHNAMGFQEGWGKALDQLVAYMKSL